MLKPDLSKSLRQLDASRKKASKRLPDRNLDRMVERMRSADRACHKMMAIEVWAIAKTVDSIFPGFWNRFMINRQTALKQFIQAKQENETTRRPIRRLTRPIKILPMPSLPRLCTIPIWINWLT